MGPAPEASQAVGSPGTPSNPFRVPGQYRPYTTIGKEEAMHQGKVKWFNNAKGYGFIIEEGESEDLFVHFSAIQMEGYKTLKAGQRVEFEKQPSDKGIHAVNIIPHETPSRRREGGESAAAQKDAGSNRQHPGSRKQESHRETA